MTSIARSSTKRVALTLPSRCFAARSSRQGVTLRSSAGIGLSIARGQQCKESARGLTLAAFRAARFGDSRPGEQVEMHPGFGGDETAHEQRRGNGAALAAADIVEVGYFGLEHRFIRPPQREPP